MEKVGKKQDIIDFYNNAAENWEQSRQDKVSRLKQMIDYAEITSGMSVLDIGCATGMCAPLCIEKNVKEYCGIDISPKMIKKARKLEYNSKTVFICGDFENKHFDVFYDRVLVFNVIPHITKVDHFIRKSCDVLSENGKLCLVNFYSKNNVHNQVWIMNKEEIIESIQHYFQIERFVDDEDKMIILASHKVK